MIGGIFDGGGSASGGGSSSGITGNSSGGTLVRVLDTVSFLDYNPSAVNSSDLTTSFQNFLLDAQLKAYALKSTALDDVVYRSVVKATCPRFNITLSSPLVVPDMVALDCPGVIFRRDGHTGSVTTAYTGDTTSKACANLQQPTIVFAPKSHNLSNLNVYCNTNGSDNGSGVFFGKNWVPNGFAVVAGGTGYTVNDVLTLGQPSKSPYVAPQITVSTVDGSGVILTATLSRAGSYGLPPILQQRQWTAANGFTGSIANANQGKVFDVSNPSWYISSGGTGTGAEFTLTYTPDFAGAGADYAYGAALQNDCLVGDVSCTTVGNIADATYGHTFGVGFAGLNYFARTVETNGGYYGIWFNSVADIVGGHFNPIKASIGIKAFSGGSIRGKVTIDTPSVSYMAIDSVNNMSLEGDMFHNSSSNAVSGYSILLGQGSVADSSHNNTGLQFNFNVYNAGAAGGIPLMNVAYTIDSQFNFNVANKDKTSSALAYPISNIANLSSTVTNCMFTGNIEGATSSLFSGTVDSSNGIRVWNAINKGFVTSPLPGTFANKPSAPQTGTEYFATDLGTAGIWITYDGTKWKPVGGRAVIVYDNTAHTAAGAASETNYAVATIPAGLTSATGAIAIYCDGKYTGTTGTKTGIVRISSSSGDTSGGTVVINNSNGGSNTALSANFTKLVKNTSTSAQILVSSTITATGGGNSTTGQTVAAINTANVWYINFNMTGNASDTVGYQGILVEWIEA